MTGNSGTEPAKLIVLRGNSASGKTSVATGIRNRDGRGIAIVSQDNLRRTVLRERDTPGGRMVYLARPIQIKDPACLVCHSTPDAAPKTMIETYGGANGFGWKVNDIIGAQVVSVPTAVPLQRANYVFKIFLLSLAAIFIFTMIMLNLMLYWFVTRRVKRLARLADEVSLGNLEAGEFRTRSHDEIGVLTEALGRMKTSMVQAIKMLEG